MVYPSHYPHGSFGIPVPNADPYRVVTIAIRRAHERDEKLGIAAAQHVRPWLQALTFGKPEYGPEQLRAEKKAVYDSGYDGWVMWNRDRGTTSICRRWSARRRSRPVAERTDGDYSSLTPSMSRSTSASVV